MAEAIGKASAQSIYDYENPNKSDSPTPEALGILAKKTGQALEWLVYGIKADEPESPFIVAMRAFEDDLDRISQRVMVKVAAVEVEETKMRRAAATLSLTPLQVALVEATAGLSDETLQVLIEQAQLRAGRAPAVETPSQEAPRRQGRREEPA